MCTVSSERSKYNKQFGISIAVNRMCNQWNDIELNSLCTCICSGFYNTPPQVQETVECKYVNMQWN